MSMKKTVISTLRSIDNGVQGSCSHAGQSSIDVSMCWHLQKLGDIFFKEINSIDLMFILFVYESYQSLEYTWIIHIFY